MKHYYLSIMTILCALAQPMQAQTILEEDFETGATVSQATPLTRGEGWTTVNSYSGSNYEYNWYNEYRDPTKETGPTISGAGCAACDAPISGTDGAGPREEILLSPELDLNDTYQLQFSWIASPMNALDYSRYDFQVRVVTDDDLGGAETVFSIQNEQMLRESGVMVYPIETWDVHVSKVDLSDWKGEKVKLAFVYKMLAPVGNIVWLDDISVKKWVPDTAPVPTLSLDRYNFGDMYIGEKMYTEVIRMTNSGKNGLQVTGMDLPEGVSCNTDFAGVNLAKYESVDFQLSYTASMTSPAQCDAVLHTTGGDVKVALQAAKQLVPEGYTLETFEGYYPPAGWRNVGFGGSRLAIEGDQSVYCGGDISNSYLRSPMLDLTDGGQVTFTFYDEYDDLNDSGYLPDQDPQLQVSHDGETWEPVWVRDPYTQLNQLLTISVDIPAGGEGESYVRWLYPAVGYDEDEGAYDHSSFTLDRVLLPNVVGADGVPTKATVIAPANGTENVYPQDVVLKWGPAQFAKGYKLYVGTNNDANDLLDGVDVGSVLSYIIPQRLQYETTYRWKVVAYNDKGDAVSVPTWRFTTQPDASIKEFPWTETFDECTDDIPTGWMSSTTSQWDNRRWLPNTYAGYNNTSLYASWIYGGEYSTLLSPEFLLPADGKSMSISFFWGDEHPRDLLKDETGLLQKQNVPGGNGRSEVVFEIGCEGEWTQAAYLSENYNEDGDTKYWRPETIDLNEYAGKTVQFRWTYRALSGTPDGAALDEIVINGTIVDGVAFNHDSWDAGMVNYQKGATSGDLFTIRNNGKNALTVKSVTFQTDDFQSDIAAGEQLAAGEGRPFAITFMANEPEKNVEDVMTIAFEGTDYEATLPVKAQSLAEDVLYYSFEPNPLEYDWKDDFTTIDADGLVNYKSNYYLTVIENDGGRYAFTSAEHSNPNLTAHGGTHTLVAAAPDSGAANDWLISKEICPSETSTFDFYARNLGTTNSVFIGDNDYHSVGVYVSETGNTKTADFKALMYDKQMDYLGENEWHHFTVDLSAYAGKNIFVAVRHTTTSANWLAFFDDFTFTGLTSPEVPTGIQAAQIGSNAEVEVYNANGQLLATGRGMAAVQQAGKGLFIVKVKDGDGQKTLRVVNGR